MIKSFSLLMSHLIKNKENINNDTFINSIDKKLYKKIYNRDVDNVDILSMLLFTKMSLMNDYDYTNMFLDDK